MVADECEMLEAGDAGMTKKDFRSALAKVRNAATR
jgi:hypothetical protein